MKKTFSQSYDVTYNKCKEALKELEISIDSHDKEKGVIQASTGTTLLSWGEDIHISIKKIGSNKTEVIITSEASAQLFTWGKDSENKKLLIEAISKKLGA